ncbi:unnamed protein product [Cylindrotheca closterium]|uniref:PAS domain-containing protein n=1 Tax=Cylindrotheca closterium TaxID=2856 RepID=A0AAD2GBS3_9STRA|nr:unnamed protein product [Cylindrotheca closterium]
MVAQAEEAVREAEVEDIHQDIHLVEPQWENTIPDDLVDHPLLLAMQESHSPFLITDPRLPGNPIIYINNGFLDMTGYSQTRVLGRNCRFMQGPETDPVVVAKLRDAVDDGRDITVTLLNYRADGSTFYNHIIISTVKDPESKEVKYFLGLTEEVSTPHGQPRLVSMPVSDPEESES